jgi:flagellar assembly protein FliH
VSTFEDHVHRAPGGGLHTAEQRIEMADPQQRHVARYEFPTIRLPGNTNSSAALDPVAVEESVLARARETAQQMIEQTRILCEADREAAHSAGFEAGFAAGMDSADRESAGLIATAEQIATRTVEEREELLRQAELEIIELSLNIARRIVNAAIEVEPELVVEVCRGAMRKAFQREHLVVVAHPDDLTMLREAGPQMAAELGGIHTLDFVEERRMERGSIVVRTPAGEIDATIDGKSEKIEDSLLELVQERRAARRSQAA